MKFLSMSTICAVLIMAGSVNAQQGGEDGGPMLTNRADSVAYAFGASVARDLKRTGLEAVNTRVLAQAIADIFAGKESPLEEVEERELIRQTIAAAQEQMYSRKRDEAHAFMETNKARPEVTTTASGLQYEVIREGDGDKPSLTDTVTVHYKGQLPDGLVFDSSYDRGAPATFPLGRVIEGWQEGLQLMPVGAQYRIYVPYELGYGEQGAGQDIPPFSPLIFEVELVAVQPAADKPPMVEEEQAK